MLYIWAKENPDYKYQQGMSDILATVVICLLSEIHIKELPSFFEPDFDYDKYFEHLKESTSD